MTRRNTQPDTIVINESWFVVAVALLFAYLGARPPGH